MRNRCLDLLLDVWLPERCSLCGDPLLFARHVREPICIRCSAAFIPITGVRCRMCGLPLISEQGICMRCREREIAIDGNVSVFLYSEIVAEAMSRYKGKGQKRLAAVFAFWLSRAYEENFSGYPVVPVPFRPAARRKRGWDQIEEIADLLHARFGIPILPLLSRNDGIPQKSLSFERRLGNLKGTIRYLPSGVRQKPRGAVLLDDIFTTGATVSECARVLKAEGVGVVYSLTLAIDP